MFNRKLTLAALAALTIGMTFSNLANAQYVSNGAGFGQPGFGYSQPAFSVCPHCGRRHAPRGHAAMPYSSQPFVSQPQIVTPNKFNGVNSWTGGINTINKQFNNTAFAPGRDASRFNGSLRYEQRPVYDVYGNRIGISRAQVWNNSHTGMQHEETVNRTANGMGGNHVCLTCK